MPGLIASSQSPSISHPGERGISLIELMITITIGMLMVAGVLALFSTTMGLNATQVRISRLDNELRHAMRQITADIRRADFRHWAPEDIGTDNIGPQSSTNPSIQCTDCDLLAADPDEINCETNGNNSSLVIRYQLYSNQSVQTYGYRQNGEQLQTGINTSGSAISTWNSLTDTNAIEISHFSIQEHLGLSACFETATPGQWARASYPAYTITIAGHPRGAADICRTIQETVRMRNAIVVIDPSCAPT